MGREAPRMMFLAAVRPSVQEMAGGRGGSSPIKRPPGGITSWQAPSGCHCPPEQTWHKSNAPAEVTKSSVVTR